jgi:hypothetical protein
VLLTVVCLAYLTKKVARMFRLVVPACEGTGFVSNYCENIKSVNRFPAASTPNCCTHKVPNIDIISMYKWYAMIFASKFANNNNANERGGQPRRTT